MNATRWLAIVLRVEGLLMLLALAAVFFPDAWLAGGYRRVGVAPPEHSAMLEYLARSLSLLYAGVGLFVVLLSLDVVRYRPLIVVLGWGHLGFAPLMLAVDLQAGMPASWMLSEVVGAALTGVLVLVLVRGVPRPVPG